MGRKKGGHIDSWNASAADEGFHSSGQRNALPKLAET